MVVLGEDVSVVVLDGGVSVVVVEVEEFPVSADEEVDDAALMAVWRTRALWMLLTDCHSGLVNESIIDSR